MPMWTLIVRPEDQRGGWTTLEIEAPSVLRASEKAKADGLVIARGAVFLSSSTECHDAKSKIGPFVRCMSCGYALDGLRIQARGIECPECAHYQLLFNTRYVGKTPSLLGSMVQVVGILLAIFGGFVALWIVMLVLAAF